jgi:hypothetical protein
MIWKSVLATLLVLWLSTTGAAQEWARKMFQTTGHDFGTVARDAKAEFEFVFTNIYMEDVHIADARTSCTCTQVSIKNAWLKTYERGAIVAKYNTRAFTGRKGATITVTIDRPFSATVQLQVTGYIRGDVVLSPSSVDLGIVDAGTPAERTVAVTYAGLTANWQVVSVQSACPHIAANVLQTRDYWGRPSSSCTLRVQLSKDAPCGYIKEHLVLLTNDQASSQIPVLVEGWIRPALTASPSSLFLGELAPGQSVTKQIVVQAQKPFRVLAVTASDNLRVSTGPNVGKDPRPVQVIPVTLSANTTGAGKLEGQIRIETDLSQPVEVSAIGVVKP